MTCWEEILLTITIATTIISCNHVQCIGMKYDYLQSVYFRPKEGNIRSLQPCNLLLLLLTIFCIIIACLFPFGELFLIRPEIYQKKTNNKDKTNSSDFSVFVREIVSTPLFCLFNFDYYALNRYNCGQTFSTRRMHFHWTL